MYYYYKYYYSFQKRHVYWVLDQPIFSRDLSHKHKNFFPAFRSQPPKSIYLPCEFEGYNIYLSSLYNKCYKRPKSGLGKKQKVSKILISFLENDVNACVMLCFFVPMYLLLASPAALLTLNPLNIFQRSLTENNN